MIEHCSQDPQCLAEFSCSPTLNSFKTTINFAVLNFSLPFLIPHHNRQPPFSGKLPSSPHPHPPRQLA